ncbi:MAG: hypothetical protein DRJ63_05105 [Thermoprotei archaeon]|nr:MAG: hypothetical protein DRJ63_05105 [Thermoprotei archaeon]
MKKIHLVSQSHIDIAWFWQWDPETIHDCCRLTFLRALLILNRVKNYKYVQDQVPFYEAMEKYYPEIFESIKRHISEGRWAVTGCMYVEADIEGLCGESLVRQCLYGKKYFLEKFGVDVKVCWIPDNWTHSPQLPQILLKSGVKYLVYKRGFKEKTVFWWKGIDGSQILACRPPFIPSFLTRPYPNLREAASLYEKYGLENAMVLVGKGDHGGGLTYQEVKNIEKLSKEHEGLQIFFSTPEEFFTAIEKEIKEKRVKLPVLRGELGWELVGCLTNRFELKKLNRLCENNLLSAEKFSTIAYAYNLLAYPEEKLRKLWKILLFNQFHDIIGGTVVEEAYETAVSGLNRVLGEAKQLLINALKTISSQIDTSKYNVNIIVFNPLSWERTDAVEVELTVPSTWSKIKLVDYSGKKALLQVLSVVKQSPSKKTVKVVFIAENIPPLGYKVYGVEEEKAEEKSELKALDNVLENSFYKVSLNEKGFIESIYDKELEVELLKNPIKLQLIEDLGDSEGRLLLGKDDFNIYTGKSIEVNTKPTVKLAEKGPVRTRLRVLRNHLSSKYIQEVVLYSKIKRVELRLLVDWHEKQKVLKTIFSFNIQQPKLTCGTQFGAIPREFSEEESPFYRWIDVSEENKSHGITVLAPFNYSYDTRNTSIRLSLLRSTVKPMLATDEGLHETVYALYSHKEDWRQAVKPSFELDNKLIPIVENRHKGKLPPTYSFLEINPPSAILTALKKAEDNEEIVLRLNEPYSRKTAVAVSLNIPYTRILLANLLEKPLKPLKSPKLSLKPFEIISLKLTK